MSQLLEFLRTHEEAFRSRARLASLYSDFRNQRKTNSDGYEANTSAWRRALASAAQAGLLPAPTGSQHDRVVVHAGEALARELQHPEFGRPLALGAAVEDGVQKKEMVPLKEFVEADQSVFQTPRFKIGGVWDVVRWGLRQLGVLAAEEAPGELVQGSFVITDNLERASRAVLEQASQFAISNTSRVFSRELFASTFASVTGTETIGPTDLNVLLIYLARDRAAVSYSPATGTIKFRSAAEHEPTAITEQDVAIASLRTLISSLGRSVEQLTSRVARSDAAAREAVANKQLITAKSALRSKRLGDSMLQKVTAQLAQLEEVYAKIEQAADQVDMVRVLEASTQTLKALNRQTGGADRVQGVVEGLRMEMMSTDEIGQAMNDVSAGVVDDAEVEDELEALGRAEEVKRLAAKAKQEEQTAILPEEQTRLRLRELDGIPMPGTLPADGKREEQLTEETRRQQAGKELE